MTQLEIRALLSRVDARLLRQEAGIRACTVARALGVRPSLVWTWETGRRIPYGPQGRAWVRFILGLQRHARVSEEITAGRGTLAA